MTKLYYTSASQTAEGRMTLHTELINEMQARIDKFVENAPVANQAQARQMMAAVMEKAQNLGNGNLLTYFCEDGMSDRNFLLYCNDLLKGIIA